MTTIVVLQTGEMHVCIDSQGRVIKISKTLCPNASVGDGYTINIEKNHKPMSIASQTSNQSKMIEFRDLPLVYLNLRKKKYDT